MHRLQVQEDHILECIKETMEKHWQVLTDRVVYRWVIRDPKLETSNLLRDKQRLTSSGMSILNVEEIGHSLTKWDLDKVLAL